MTERQNIDGGVRAPYHHGNLRDALILAAAALIREQASTDIAMVDAARRAGVSSAAPYRHFKDRRALLEAVRQVAFMGLARTLHQITAELAPGTEESIIAIGRGYIDFVTSHPEFYGLMWGEPGLRGIGSDEEGIRNSCFNVLVDAVCQWCNRNYHGPYTASDLAVKLWAMAHGLACLGLTGALDPVLPNGDIHDLLDSAIRTFLEGLAHPCKADSSHK